MLNCPDDKFIIIGDFNMSGIQWISRDSVMVPSSYAGNDECSLIDEIHTLNLNQYNWIFNRFGKLLDLVLSNDFVCVTGCTVPLVPIDPYHEPLTIQIKFTTVIPLHTAPQIKYFYNKGDYKSINNELATINWESEFSDRTLDQALDFFYATFKKLRNKFIPSKLVKKDNYPVWYSLSLKKSIKEKYKYFKKYKKYKNLSDLISYNTLRDRVRKLEDTCFTTYIHRVEKNIATNPKQFWSFVKSRSSSQSLPSSLKYGDSIFNSGLDICNAFSDYFSTTFTVSNQNIHNQSPYPSYDSAASLNSIEINPDTVTNILLKLDSSKSAGPDELPAQFLINCAKSLVCPIVLLFRRSFAECSIPSIWKSAFITPVHKKGPKTEITNYRPISKLCILSKVLEKIVFKQVYDAFKHSFNDHQHGFLQRRSTVSNLVLLNDYVTEAMDSGLQVDVIYTDYSKCFDRIDHGLLISKLYDMGIHGDLLRWFSSYINNRSQAVVVNNYISGWVTVPSGVPQGSLLGPLLFNMFINDIGKCFRHSKLLCFADDMKIINKIKSDHDSMLLQSDLVRLDEYCKINMLELNPSKCFSITFSRQRNVISKSYTIKGQPLEKITYMKDLGIIHDSKLIFDKHVDSIISGALKALGFIMRNSLYFTQAKTLKVLYCAYVRSKLEYASQVWNPCYNTYVDRIERVQQKFIKYLCFKLKFPYSSSNYLSICKKHHLVPLQKRREISDITFLLNITSGVTDCPELLSKLSFNTPYRSKRYYPPISIKTVSSKYRQNSFLVRASRKLNELSKELDIDIFNCKVPNVRHSLVKRCFM